MEHARYSPSGSEIWINCPGALEMQDQFDDVETEEAKRGSMLHDFAEKRLKGKFVTKKKFGEDWENWKSLTQEDRNQVEFYVSHIEFFSGNQYVEERVNFPEFVPEGFGTVDFATFDEKTKTVYIRDAKFGRVEVRAKKNTQMMLYALGFLKTYDSEYNSIKKFEIGIVMTQYRSIDLWEITVEDLLTWANTELKDAVSKTLVKNPELVAGSHCIYCDALANCATSAKHGFNIFSDYQDVLLTNEQFSKVLKQLDKIKRWVTKVEETAKDKALAGEKIPDFKLVKGRRRQSWNDEHHAAQYLSAKLTADVAKPRVLISPSTAKELIDERTKRFLEKNLIDWNNGPLVLVPRSDKKEEFSLAKSKFKKLR